MNGNRTLRVYCQVKGLKKTAAFQETADSHLDRLPQKDSYLETKVLAKLLGNMFALK